MVIGLIIIAVGIIALLVKLDVLSGSIWDYTWPTVLIIIGISFILSRFRRRRRWEWFWGQPWDNRDKPAKE